MRTSLNNLQQLEEHLFKRLSGEDETLFQAKLILDTNLAENLEAQQKAYRLIRMYGRKQLRQEIDKVHHNLFNDVKHKSFQQKIKALFGRK